MGSNPGANWEIAVDGKARSYRDDLEIAREAARYLKIRNPKSEIRVRNYTNGEVVPTAVDRASIAWADSPKPGRKP